MNYQTRIAAVVAMICIFAMVAFASPPGENVPYSHSYHLNPILQMSTGHQVSVLVHSRSSLAPNPVVEFVPSALENGASVIPDIVDNKMPLRYPLLR